MYNIAVHFHITTFTGRILRDFGLYVEDNMPWMMLNRQHDIWGKPRWRKYNIPYYAYALLANAQNRARDQMTPQQTCVECEIMATYLKFQSA